MTGDEKIVRLRAIVEDLKAELGTVTAEAGQALGPENAAKLEEYARGVLVRVNTQLAELKSGDIAPITETTICRSSPADDLVGMPCSNCGHHGHWLVECQNCKLDLRVTELDDLIAEYRRRLAV